MKSFLVLAILLFLSPALKAQSPFEYFFKPRPIPTDTQDFGESRKWEFKPTVQLPGLKLVESTRESAEIDAFILTSVGGGITYQNSGVKNGKNYAFLSFSPMVLLSGNIAEDGAVLDFSFAGSVGFFNNLLQLGIGRDFGNVPSDRSRIFGLLSIGVNLTENGPAQGSR